MINNKVRDFSKNKNLRHTNISVKALSIDNAKHIRSIFKTSDYYKYAINNNDESAKVVKSFGLFHHNAQAYIGIIEVYTQALSDHLWINTIAIDACYLRHGYGTYLLKSALESLSKEIPFNKIILACDRSNVIGLKFWTNNDFMIHEKMTKNCGKANVNIMTRKYNILHS